MLSKLRRGVSFFKIELIPLSNLVSKKLVSHHFILTARKKAEQTNNQQCCLDVSEKIGHRVNFCL